MEAQELILPPGVEHSYLGGQGEVATVVNDTDLPDDVVVEAAKDAFVEHASLAWGHGTTFQTYANEGSLLARKKYTTPASVFDEIRLARDLAERDDDVSAVIGQLIALAFGDGMENHHEDELHVAAFNQIAKNMDLDMALMELYRELLISSSLTTATLFTRETFDLSLAGVDESVERSLAAPLMAPLPAENVRVIGNDLFKTGTLAYSPDDDSLRRWLDEFFDPKTTAARKAQMGREDRVSANLFTGIVELSSEEAREAAAGPFGTKLYLLNPLMVQRTGFPKGAWKYPRPLMTRDFALLEAKRLLNIMDYALLQGGSNFIVVAKKGSDDRPAQGPEIANLREVVKQASKTGVIVGDHRLDFDIITPKLDELLNPAKRQLIGRRLAAAMMRIPDRDSGSEQADEADAEMITRVVASDRRIISRHVVKHAYGQTVRRNRKVLKSEASIWFPKVILQGAQFFSDYVLKLRDRGDIPRKWAVKAAGYNYEAAVQQRKRELEAGDDEILIPGVVPHSSPEAGPQDNGDGRPKGSGDGSRPDPAAPRREIIQTPGETVKAYYDGDLDEVVRIGSATQTILDEYPDATVGRITSMEREALDTGETVQRGSVVAVAVNPGIKVGEERAVRLADGLSVIVGKREGDKALLAKLLVFREPEWELANMETAVARWGYPVVELLGADDPEGKEIEKRDTRDIEEMAKLISGQTPNIHVEIQQGRVKRIVKRDEDGAIIGTEEIPVEDGDDE